MPVFGPGGEVVAAIEVAVAELGHELPPIMAALSIASRSLSRELAGEARLSGAGDARSARRSAPVPRGAAARPADCAGASSALAVPAI